jgi:CRISPR-associated endonuclease/helicase Cas3
MSAPQSLAAVGIDDARPALPVLRRTDLLALFDTQADLAGHDIDVSGFVRATENDDDVQVLWRVWEGDKPPENLPAPLPNELCRVPVWQLKSLVGKGVAWRWSSLRRAWEPVREWELHPGLTLLLPTSAGGYSSSLGWTGDKKDVPARPWSCPPTREPNDFDEGDPWTHATHDYVELVTHSGDVVEAVASLQDRLSGLDLPWPALHPSGALA